MADMQQKLLKDALRLVELLCKASATSKSARDLQQPVTILRDYFNKLLSATTSVLTDSQKQQAQTMCSRLEDLEQLIGRDYLPTMVELLQKKLTRTAELASSSRADLLTVVRSLYSCFSNVVLGRSSTGLQTDYMLKEKARLLDELMAAPHDDIIRKLLEEDKSYEEYFTDSVISRLQAPETFHDDYTKETRKVIEGVAMSYGISPSMLIEYVCRKCATYIRRDPAWIASLHEHIPQSSEDQTSTFEEVLTRFGQRDWWTIEEVESFRTLFKKYSEKVQCGHLTRRTVSLAFRVNLDTLMFRLKSDFVYLGSVFF